MSLPNGYDKFRQSRVEMADGMKGVDHTEYSWGEKFEWEALPILGTNIAVITDKISKEDLSDLEEWKQENENRVIATVDPNLIASSDLLFDDELVILRRKATKDRAPIIPDFTVRHFSFENRDLRIDSRRMTATLSSVIGDNQEERIQVERYVGGVLHMLNGKIWVLENNQENIIAAVVYGSAKTEEYWNLEVMGVVENFKETELLKKLLQFTFEGYQSTPLYYFSRRGSPEYQLLITLDFEDYSTLKLTD